MIVRSVVLLAAACLSVPAAAQVEATSFESGGVELRAYLHHGAGSEPRALALYLHGNPGSPLEEASVVADTLIAVGVDVFRLNYTGLWGNDGDFNLASALGDLDAALDFLTAPETADRFGLDPTHIILVGYSFGTATSLVGARDDDRVDGIVSLAPCDHGYFGAQWLDPSSEIHDFLATVTEELFGADGPIDQDAAIFVDDLTENARSYSFVEGVEGLLPKKLLFLVGLDDEVCYAEDHFFPLYRMLTRLDHPALDARILGMGHGLGDVGLEALMELTAEWIQSSFSAPSGGLVQRSLPERK